MAQVLVEAHRGDSANAPENTIAAFRRAVSLGAYSLELDVHLTRDGRLAVIHDDNLDRTTNGTGPVSAMTAAELRKLDAGSWFGPQFAGERVPLLEEVLELVQPTRLFMNIEIKSSPDAGEAARAVVSLLEERAMVERCLLSSFDALPLQRAGDVHPGICLALTGKGMELLEAVREMDFPWMHPWFPSVDAELVREAHAAGVRVNAWTVDSPDDLRAMRLLGVDKICSNRPAEMLAALRE